MFLAEVKDLEGVEADALALRDAMEYWSDCPASDLSHHDRPCCERALDWLAAMDYSHSNGSSPLTGPRWIRARFSWGPTCWPLHWCDALEAKTLDCGALAALAHKAFVARGLECHVAQLIQRYSVSDSVHWTCNWRRARAHTLWIRGDLVYHEACAVVSATGAIRIWDPTASWWVPAEQAPGYAEVLAVRILTGVSARPSRFAWGPHMFVPNLWRALEPGTRRE